MELLAERLAAAGLGRREFLRIAGGLAAMGAVGFNVTPASAAPKLAPGEKLAKDQTSASVAAACTERSVQPRLQQGPLLLGRGRPVGRPQKFNADFLAGPRHRREMGVERRRLGLDLHDPQGLQVEQRRPRHGAGLRVVVEAAARPGLARRRTPAFLYDLKNGEAFNKKQMPDAKDVGVKAKDDRTLVATLEGPRGYFPALVAYQAALPAHRPSVEKHGNKWTEAANGVWNGPFKLDQVGARQAHQMLEERELLAPRTSSSKRHHPDHSRGSPARCLRERRDRLTRAPVGELKRMQAGPKLARRCSAIRSPAPGTWCRTSTWRRSTTQGPPGDGPRHRPRDVVKMRRASDPRARRSSRPASPAQPDNYEDQRHPKYDPKLAMEMLKGTPFEGGKNWPKITLTMRDEALGAEAAGGGRAAVAAREPQHEDRARGRSSRACSASGCGRTTSSSCGSAGSWTTRTRTTSTSTRSTARRRPASARPGSTTRSTRSSRPDATRATRRSACEHYAEGRGDHADRRRLRAGRVGRALRGGEADGARASRRTSGASSVVIGNIYADMFSAPVHGRQGVVDHVGGPGRRPHSAGPG